MDPILLHYTINPSIPPPERPAAWDVELKTDDTTMKGRMQVMVQANKDSAQDLAKLDEEVSGYTRSSRLSFSGIFLFLDCSPRAIAPQFASQTHLPSIFRQQSFTIHTNVARITITRFGKHSG